MSESDFIAPAVSWNDVAKTAEDVRAKTGYTTEPDYPVMAVVENLLYTRLGFVELRVSHPADMPGIAAQTSPSGDFIELSENIYRGAWENDGFSRFTVAHELGHLFMHTRVPLRRVQAAVRIKPFRSGERQANRFAAELLMPLTRISAGDTTHAVAERHSVSLQAAQTRLTQLKKESKL